MDSLDTSADCSMRVAIFDERFARADRKMFFVVPCVRSMRRKPCETMLAIKGLNDLTSLVIPKINVSIVKGREQPRFCWMEIDCFDSFRAI